MISSPRSSAVLPFGRSVGAGSSLISAGMTCMSGVALSRLIIASAQSPDGFASGLPNIISAIQS